MLFIFQFAFPCGCPPSFTTCGPRWAKLVCMSVCVPIVSFSFPFMWHWPSQHHRTHRVWRGCSLFYAETIIKRKIKLAKTGVWEACVEEGKHVSKWSSILLGENGKLQQFDFLGKWNGLSAYLNYKEQTGSFVFTCQAKCPDFRPATPSSLMNRAFS